MIRSLQNKMVLSLFLLILMLLAAAVISTLEFRKIGESVDRVLTNNYRSIEAAKKMMDALERENSGLLLWMIGDRDAGLDTILSSHTIIRNAIREVEKNITEADEPRLISNITEAYGHYHTSVLAITGNEWIPEDAKEQYDREAQEPFFRAKKAVNKLMMLNQEQTYRQSCSIQESSRRAMMPAFVSIVVAVLFSLLLYYFIRLYFIRPVQHLTESIREYYPEKGRLDAGIVSRDEFKSLEEEMNKLISRLLRKREQNNE